MAIARQSMLGGVRKSAGAALHAEGEQRCIVRDAPERNEHARAFELRELHLQIAVALANLIGQGLVLGRCALHGIADACAPQLEPIIGGVPLRLARETERVQRLIEEDAGEVACEGPPRAIRTVHSRCEPDEHDPWAGVAEGGDGPAPVLGVARVRLGEIGRESRAARAVRIVDRAQGYSSMCRMMAEANPEVLMSFAPGISRCMASSTLRREASSRFGTRIASRSRARS
jgi:hypothetical protein